MRGRRLGVRLSQTATPGAFSVDVRVVGDDAIVAVRGEVDLVTAAALGGAVDAMIERGRRHLVLDLAQLEFIDAAGLRVFVATLGRLRDVDGTLVFRSPSPTILETLEITGLAEVVPLERAEPPRLEPPRPAPSPRFDRSLARAAADQARKDVLRAALDLVVVLARATVVGADGVSVSLAGDGGLITVASSDDTVEAMDADQYVTGEGPCLTAAAEGHRVEVESVDVETRWPAFTPRARERGINAILSNPLRAGTRPTGALNIYSRTPNAFGRDGRELATLFADQASIVLMHASDDLAQDKGGRLSDALRTREVIAQAQGALMERDGIAADEAFAVLRHSSRRTSTPLRRLAQEIVASTRHVSSRDEDRR